MRAKTKQPAEPAGSATTGGSGRSRPGIAHRDAGQALATARAAGYRGFTTAIPHVAKACAVIQEAARRGAPGRAATETLTALLRLLPHRWWHGPPVLRVTNARLSREIGCSERQVRRHLAVLHQMSVIAIDWGRGNTRLRFDVQAGEHEPGTVPGIDLRPALVFAHEQQVLARAIKAAQQRFQSERNTTLDAIWKTKQSLIHQQQRLPPISYSEAGQQIERLRQDTAKAHPHRHGRPSHSRRHRGG